MWRVCFYSIWLLADHHYTTATAPCEEKRIYLCIRAIAGRRRRLDRVSPRDKHTPTGERKKEDRAPLLVMQLYPKTVTSFNQLLALPISTVFFLFFFLGWLCWSCHSFEYLGGKKRRERLFLFWVAQCRWNWKTIALVENLHQDIVSVCVCIV